MPKKRRKPRKPTPPANPNPGSNPLTELFQNLDFGPPASYLTNPGEKAAARWGMLPAPAPRRSPRLLEARPGTSYTVRIDLQDAEPPIWRRLELAGDLTLPEVHRAIVTAFGWHDTHLHQFTMDASRGVQPFVHAYAAREGDIPPGGILEEDVRLSQVVAAPGDELLHEYDFGDGWEHLLRVEAVRESGRGAPRALCLDGRRAGPPEDCGGIPGLLDILDVLAGGEAQFGDTEEIRGWLPPGYDPAAFDRESVNQRLSEVFGGGSRTRTGGRPSPSTAAKPSHLIGLRGRLSVPGRTRLDHLLEQVAPSELTDDDCCELTRGLRVFLELVGADGLTLTGAGYLKPADVERLVDGFGLTGELYGKANREQNVPTVTAVRSAATLAKLVRKQTGRLLLTPAGRTLYPGNLLGDDPRPLLDHVLRSLPCGKGDAEKDAGLAWMLGAALRLDSLVTSDLAAELLAAAGFIRSDGQPISGRDASQVAQDTRDVLSALDVRRPARRFNDPRPESITTAMAIALTGGTLS